jgi:hypothetical protein
MLSFLGNGKPKEDFCCFIILYKVLYFLYFIPKDVVLFIISESFRHFVYFHKGFTISDWVFVFDFRYVLSYLYGKYHILYTM